MSQPLVTSYFNTRKRPATDDLRNKAKVLLLDREDSKTVSNQSENQVNKDSSELSGSLTPIQEEQAMGTSPKVILVSGKESKGNRTVKSNSAVRNIQFDSPKTNAQKILKNNARTRVTRSRKLSGQEGQTDIRESFQKVTEDTDAKKVLFEKKGALSPRKKCPETPKKNTSSIETVTSVFNDQIPSNCTTPKKSSAMDKLAKQELSLNEIKNRINKSSRLMELKASIARFKNCEQKLEKLQKQNEIKKPQIQKFEKIQLEIPVR